MLSRHLWPVAATLDSRDIGYLLNSPPASRSCSPSLQPLLNTPGYPPFCPAHRGPLLLHTPLPQTPPRPPPPAGGVRDEHPHLDSHCGLSFPVPVACEGRLSPCGKLAAELGRRRALPLSQLSSHACSPSSSWSWPRPAGGWLQAGCSVASLTPFSETFQALPGGGRGPTPPCSPSSEG